MTRRAGMERRDGEKVLSGGGQTDIPDFAPPHIKTIKNASQFSLDIDAILIVLEATEYPKQITGFSSEIGNTLRDWAIGQAGGSCYSWAALSSNDSKTRYTVQAYGYRAKVWLYFLFHF